MAKKIKYVRIISVRDIGIAYPKLTLGAVGIVRDHSDDMKLVFATVGGKIYILKTKEIEYITKKEYFIGALGG